MNSNNDIVGESDIPSCANTRAAVWPGGDFSSVAALPLIDIQQPEDTYANAISDQIAGELYVVGRSELPSNAATLWHGTPPNWDAYDLNEISCNNGLSEFAPPVLREATDVNNLGWIVGRMLVAISETQTAVHAFLLIPNDWCPGDINAGAPDGVVNVPDLLALLGAWGDCPQDECCLADLNGDGDVDVADLLALLGAWGLCPGFDHLPAPEPFEDVIVDKGLTMQKWNDFEDVMENGTSGEKANHLCWMQNYLMQCQICPTCPSRDPFAD